MDFLDNISEELKLTPEQVTSIKEKGTTYLNEQKSNIEKEFDTKYREEANRNAENILSDVSKGMESLTGIKKENGVKYVDHIKNSTDLYFKGKQSSLDSLKEKYEKLISEGDKSGAVKQKLQEVEAKLEGLQKKEALFSEYEKEDYKNKYIDLKTKYSTERNNNAFNSVKPIFPEKVNKFEATAKWNDCINSIRKEYDIDYDENNNPVAINKENKFKIVPLEKLIQENDDVQNLLKETTTQGAGGGSVKMVKFEGLPFELPEKATSEQKTLAIRKQLETEGIIDKIDSKYSKRFEELMNQINKKA